PKHLRSGMLRSLVQRACVAEREDLRRRLATWPLDTVRGVHGALNSHLELHIGGDLYASAGQLAGSLDGVRVADAKEGTGDEDWEAHRHACPQAPVVHVPAMLAGCR